MISDDDLYRLAIFLGSVAMVLIVVYHFFEVNSADSALAKKAAQAKPVQQAPAVGKSSSVAKRHKGVVIPKFRCSDNGVPLRALGNRGDGMCRPSEERKNDEELD
ncbi:hypothetical protein JX266_007412 [Neoarthrinium moseri]|nr:hypothetical protein JX266_007412 [Neoarthrinium moseri]